MKTRYTEFKGKVTQSTTQHDWVYLGITFTSVLLVLRKDGMIKITQQSHLALSAKRADMLRNVSVALPIIKSELCENFRGF